MRHSHSKGGGKTAYDCLLEEATRRVRKENDAFLIVRAATAAPPKLTTTPCDTYQLGWFMSTTQLTFLDDTTLLVISSIGIVGIVTVILWVSLGVDWQRLGEVDREDHGDPAQLGPRTRVVPGGREAAKAARKEAKKKAKAEFKRAQPSSTEQERRSRLQAEVSEAQHPSLEWSSIRLCGGTLN